MTTFDVETGEVLSEDHRISVYTPPPADELAIRTDAELVALSEAALEFTIAQLDDMALEDAPNLRAQSQALEKLLAAHLRSKEAKLEAANNLTEARLRIERHTGAIIRQMQKAGVLARPGQNLLSPNTTGALSTYAITRDQSSTWQKVERVAPDVFEDYIATGKENLWELSTAGLLWYARQQAMADPGEAPPLPEGEYDLIYADPPWRYEFSATKRREIENHYDTMTLDEIKQLAIPSAENAILFLWATAPKLAEALEVMSAWGFVYRTCAVWDKEVLGMGYWFRIQHELLLVGVKGDFPSPKPSARVRSVIRSQRQDHSQKPEIIYDLLERMFPDARYLELFARGNQRQKWAVWGKEA